jgi:hypothetical protein
VSCEIDELSGLRLVARPWSDDRHGDAWDEQSAGVGGRRVHVGNRHIHAHVQDNRRGPMLKFSRLATAALLAVVFATPAFADLSTCENLYVGRIWVERGTHLRAVVLLNSPSDASGSYWIYFDTWSLDEKKAALATLTAAKLVGQRVHVTTDESTQCGITSGGTHAKAVFLATNP